MIEWLGRKEAYHNLYSQCLAIKLAVEVDETAGGAVPRAGSILDSSSTMIRGQYLAQFRAPLESISPAGLTVYPSAGPTCLLPIESANTALLVLAYRT